MSTVTVGNVYVLVGDKKEYVGAIELLSDIEEISLPEDSFFKCEKPEPLSFSLEGKLSFWDFAAILANIKRFNRKIKLRGALK